MSFNLRCQKKQNWFVLGLILILVTACVGLPEIKRTNVIYQDALADGTTKGVVDGGMWTETGWQAGANGMLKYDLPGMSQGTVEFDVTGLNRLGGNTAFITMYEPGGGKYADPYVIHNPYLAKITIKSFKQSPDSTFDFLWTIKTFPPTVKPLDRYIEGAPEGGEAYIEAVPSKNVPIFLDETYHITMEWKYGQASLYVGDSLVARHDYRPMLYLPSALTLVLGKSPADESFGLPNMTISNVKISFPQP